MNKENIPVITDREKLYDKCENMEQLFDKYYLPLLDKHYSKTYKLQQENEQLKEELKYTVPIVEHNKIVSKKLKENQELKKQYCERTDCSGRLGNSKKVDQLEKELEQLKEIEKEHRTINGELRVENKELKKQLEEADLELQLLDMITDENIKYKNQQKEFIEFLENEININPYDISDYDYEDIINTILSKYKSIIGG